MVKVTWSPSAVRDFQIILAYIGRDAPVGAKRFAKKLLERSRQLKTSPFMGGYVLEDETHTYRELVFGNYRLIYRCADDGKSVYVVAVHHAARLLDPRGLG